MTVALRKDKEWQELYDRAKDWEYGQSITHQEIADIMSLPYGSQQYYQNVRACNEKLKEDANRHLVTLPKHGYKVAEPAEHMTECMKKMQQAYATTGHANKILFAAPVDKLTDEEKERYYNTTDRVLKLRQTFKQDTDVMALIVKGKAKLDNPNSSDLPKMLKG